MPYLENLMLNFWLFPYSLPMNALFQQIKATWVSDPALEEIIAKLQVDPFRSYTWCNEQLRWKGRLVVP